MMGVLSLKTLLAKRRRRKMTVEMVTGQILQHLEIIVTALETVKADLRSLRVDVDRLMRHTGAASPPKSIQKPPRQD